MHGRHVASGFEDDAHAIGDHAAERVESTADQRLELDVLGDRLATTRVAGQAARDPRDPVKRRPDLAKIALDVLAGSALRECQRDLGGGEIVVDVVRDPDREAAHEGERIGRRLAAGHAEDGGGQLVDPALDHVTGAGGEVALTKRAVDRREHHDCAELTALRGCEEVHDVALGKRGARDDAIERDGFHGTRRVMKIRDRALNHDARELAERPHHARANLRGGIHNQDLHHSQWTMLARSWP